jgi:tetratricopeptide (TPR) repeat protein
MNDVVPLLKHTPSAQDPRVLEAITVQREPLISSLVEAVLDIDGGLRHQLLVGPRGMGKTHVLSLVASRVRNDRRADDLVIAWLVEDNWTIRTYDKFLAAILARVAVELGDAELEARAESLRASDGTRWLEGEEALREALGDRRLVLLAENLDDVFRRIGGEGQARFRAFVENWRQLLILATAPQLFEGVQQHASPFYGFFAITHLDELTLASATELLQRVAELQEDTDLLRFLGTETANRRLAAIEALAGGHPRIWLLLAGCISIAAIDDLVPLFLKALDELTPYYQDRLRELSDQQQELIVLLAEAGGALSNRTLAERSGIGQNQIATMLRQLTDRGYVRPAQLDKEVATGDQRMSFWELREPLMRLCLDVKQARGKPLRMVVEFLRSWYGSRLLDELVRLPAEAELAASYAGEAFRMLDGDSLSPDDLLRGSSAEIIARAERGLAISPERSVLQVTRATGLIMAGRFVEARDSLRPLAEGSSSEAVHPGLRLMLAVAEESLGEPDALDLVVRDLLGPGEAGNQRVEVVGAIAAAYDAMERLQDALDAYEKAIQLAPTDARLRQRFGLLAARDGRFEESLAALTKATELEPDNSSFHTNLGGALRRLGRFEESLVAHERAVELDPKEPRARNRYGAALGMVGRADEALESFHRAIELEPENGEFHSNLGVQLARMNRPEDALAALERAVELMPSSAIPLLNLGHALRQADRTEEAIDVYRRAIEVAPDNADFHNSLSRALDHLGRYEEALEAQRQAVALQPGDVSLLGGLGHALGRLKRYEEALEALSEAAELEPDDPGIIRNRAAALSNLGRVEEALELFTRAVELRPDDPEYRAQLGGTLRRLGRIEEALDVLERAHEVDPGDPNINEALGVALVDAGRAEDGLPFFDRAAEVKPSNAVFHNHRANTLRELGRHREAEAAARRAIELEEEPTYRFTLAEVLLDRGEADAALETLEGALETWQSDSHFKPGETDLLCRIIWERFRTGGRRAEIIDRVARAYAGVGAMQELGSGIVATIPLLLGVEVGQAEAEAWLADWAAAPGGEELEIPRHMLAAAVAWKHDRNRAHLLELPPEQREILIGMLPLQTADPA